jgi:hypothetical protein
VSFVTKSRGNTILHTDVNQYANALNGTAGGGQEVRLAALDDDAAYANILGNADTTNGYALKVQYGDPNGSPTTIATFAKAGVAFSVPVTGINAFTVYNVLAYGIVTGADSTFAAANTAALIALWADVIDNGVGGGTIYFPPGTYPFNATTLDHGGGFSGVASIRGSGGAAILNFYGTTGPYLNIATTSASAVARCGIYDLRIQHAAVPASGATIQLGYVQQYELDGVRIPATSSSLASFVALRLTGTINGLHVRDCKFDLQSTGAVVPIGIDVANTGTLSAGLHIMNTDISGYAGASIGIRFINTIDWDTVWLGPGTNLKDHDVGILKTSGDGAVSNLIANGLVIDACDIGVQAEPTATSEVSNWQFVGCWLSANDYNVIISENGGTLRGFQLVGNYLTSADTISVSVGAGCAAVVATGNHISSDQTTDWVFDVAASTEDVLIANNIMSVANAAAGLIRINATCDPVLVEGNILRGGADADGISFGGATDASRVNGTNAYQAL